jgi:hypothetical protein
MIQKQRAKEGLEQHLALTAARRAPQYGEQTLDNHNTLQSCAI